MHKACWVSATDSKAMAEFLDRRKRDIAKDSEGQLVFLAVKDNNKGSFYPN